MAAVTQTITNYLGGVSNQPDDKKLLGQVTQAKNAYPDPTFGLQKRPGFKYLLELKDGIPTGGSAFDQTDLDTGKWFYYNRDADERYIGCIIGNASADTAAIHVWNAIDLKKATVNYTATTFTITESGNSNSGNNGTYTGVSVTGGSGSGMKVTLTVSGGEVTVAALHTEGTGYKRGETVTVPKANAGNTQVDPQLTIATINSRTYLNSTAASDYDFLTIRDTSIVTNKQKEVTLQATPSYTDNKKATIRLHLVEYASKYQVVLTKAGTTYTCTLDTKSGDTAASDAATTNFLKANDILTSLKAGSSTGGAYSHTNAGSGLNGISGITATIVGTSIELEGDGAFTVSTITGGKGGNGLTGYQESVDNVTQLTTESIHGRIVKIVNTADASDTYYAKFVANDGTSGPGTWEETIAPNVSPGLEGSTMPHQLKNTAKNVFTFEPITWIDRLVGDDTTNEHPSFANATTAKTIQQAFYYNNRLGFLTEDNVSMSQSQDFFNFYMTTAQTSTDADPIDISVSSIRPATLHGIIPTASGLLLFSQNQQFILFSAEGNLTPSTALIRGLSNYQMDENIDPVDVGTSVNFVSKTHTTAGFTRIFGMIPQGMGQAPKVVDVGRIVAEYVPATITALTASPQNSFIAMYGTTLDKVYFYRTYSDGEKDIMQTWFDWELPGNAHFIEVDSDTMYSIIKTGTGASARYNLCSATMTQTPEEEIIVTAEGQQVNPHMDFYKATTAISQYPVESVTITNGGSGYSGTPTVAIAAPASGTQATGTATVAGNAVTGITITNPGKGYDPANPPAVTFSGGGGSNAAGTAVVYDGSYAEIPFSNLTSSLEPVVVISGNATSNFSGTTESGFTTKPGLATVGSTNYYTIPKKDLSGQAAKVFLGYKYKYDIALPKIYFRRDPERKVSDYTANLTVARCKFSIGQSSVVGFKLKRKGVQSNTQSFTGDGSTTAFSPDFDVKDKNDVIVKKNNAIQTIVTDYTIADHASLEDKVTVTFGSAPAKTTFWAHSPVGTGYSNGAGVATTGGSGTGLTVDITTSGGAITAAVVNQSGTGYKVNELITVSTGGANAKLMIKTLPDSVEIYMDQWYTLTPTQEANYYLGDDVPLETQNIFSVPIHQKSDNYTLRVFSDSPFPLALTSMSWEGNYSPRYYRRT